MDFHSLSRRELQSLCKKNKIPANMTNVAMADALKALEIVEGLEEFMNQSESSAFQSPLSIAKELPDTARTATRTTRRKITKEETQSTQSVARSCRVTRKALAGELDRENQSMNVLQSPPVPASHKMAAVSVAQKSEINDVENDVNVGADVPKTPAAQSTRRRANAAASRSKAPVIKKDESVQRVYSTRRSVRLLEKSMSELSLKPKEALDEPVKNEEPEKETAAPEKNPAGAEILEKSDYNSERTGETEVKPGRDLSATLEKEWETRDKVPEDHNESIHSDWEIVDSEEYVILNDISASNTKPETYKEKMKEIDTSSGGDLAEKEAEEKESKMIPVLERSFQIDSKSMNQDDDSEMPGHAKETLDLEPAESEKSNTKDVTSSVEDEKMTPRLAEDSTEKCEVGLENGETMMNVSLDEAIKDDPPVSEDTALKFNADNDSAHDAFNDKKSASEESDNDSDDSESESDSSSDSSESEQTETESDSEVDPEEDMSDVDSNQAVFGSDTAVHDADFNGGSGSKGLAVDELEELESDSDESSESDQTEAESDLEEDESDQTEAESELEEDPEEDNASDVDSNQAVFGSDVAVNDAGRNIDSAPRSLVVDQLEEQEELKSSADSHEYDNGEELVDSKTKEDERSKSRTLVSDKKTPTSPRAIASGGKDITLKSPFAEESISGQFPRPTMSTPGKSSTKKNKSASALKLTLVVDNNDSKDKENNMDNNNSGRKAEQLKKDKAKKNTKTNMFDEESLKEASLRQLTKMLKEVNIKKSSRTALQKLPDDNQISEQN